MQNAGSKSALRWPAVSAVLMAVLVGASTFSFVPASAQIGHPGPSFSCMQAPEAGAEQMICADAELSRQDRVMATAYGRARDAVRGSEGYGALQENQKSWLRQREACASLNTQKGLCISDLTDKRIAKLNQWASLKMDPDRVVAKAQKTGTTKGSRPPQGPSFNCAAARTLVERTICADRQLSGLDREVSVIYSRLVNAYKARPELGTMGANLRTEQRAFIANRNRCSLRPDTIQMCLIVSYENRVMSLNEQIEEVAP
jgi:uncharacterized protein